MTPDLKRLCDRVYAACEDRALLADSSDAEAIVRAVLTELREVSEDAIAAASVDFLRDVTDPWDCMPGDWDEAFGLSNEGPEAWEPAEERIRPRTKRAFTAMIDHILAEPATA